MQVKKIPISSIKVGERFRQDYGTEKEMADLRDNIKSKGLIQPITLDEDSNLVAGGRRLQACTDLGFTEIDAIIRKVEGELDAKELELFENIHRKQMTWAEIAKANYELFCLKRKSDSRWTYRDHANIVEMSVEPTHRSVNMGYILTEIAPDLANHKTQKDALKAWDKTIKEAGNRAALDKVPPEHKSLIDRARADYRTGDALSGMRDEPSDSVDFVECDPPYGVALDQRKSRNKGTYLTETYTEVDADAYAQWLLPIATEVYRIMKPNTFCVWWYGMSQHHTVLQVLRQVGFGVPDIPAIWYKQESGNGQTASPETTFGSIYEPFFLCRKGKPEMQSLGSPNVFPFKTLNPDKKIHTTEKPIDLYVDILTRLIRPGCRIMCPFLGSGALLRAIYTMDAKHTGFGWDTDPSHKISFLGEVLVDASIADGQAKAAAARDREAAE